MATEALGGILALLARGDAGPVPALAADPTLTATAGALLSGGTFGGNVYLHLTAATDTVWLKLNGLGATGLYPLTSDPRTSGPDPGPIVGTFGTHADIFYLRVGSGTNTWIALDDLNQLVLRLGALTDLATAHDALVGLAGIAGDLVLVQQQVAIGSVPSSNVTLAQPSLFVDNDWLSWDLGDGTTFVTEFQCSDGFVAAHGGVVVDLRGLVDAPASGPDGGGPGSVLGPLKTAVEAGTGLRMSLFGVPDDDHCTARFVLTTISPRRKFYKGFAAAHCAEPSVTLDGLLGGATPLTSEAKALRTVTIRKVYTDFQGNPENTTAAIDLGHGGDDGVGEFVGARIIITTPFAAGANPMVLTAGGNTVETIDQLVRAIDATGVGNGTVEDRPGGVPEDVDVNHLCLTLTMMTGTVADLTAGAVALQVFYR